MYTQAIHTAALYVGYAILTLSALAGAGAAIFGAAWWIFGKIVAQVWTLDVFYATCKRILDERKTPDRNQLAGWPPKDRTL